MQSTDGGEDDNMTTAMHEDLLPSVKDWSCLLLATPVQFGVSRRFNQNTYRGLVQGHTMGMDFLVVMGTPSTYLYLVIVFILRIVAADQDDVNVDCKANAHV
jgi:cation transport ATPase